MRTSEAAEAKQGSDFMLYVCSGRMRGVCTYVVAERQTKGKYQFCHSSKKLFSLSKFQFLPHLKTIIRKKEREIE